jgi:hypothetical protein
LCFAGFGWREVINMADIVLSSGNICRPFRSPWGAFPTRSFGVSTGISSATIHLGRPVTLDYTEANNTSNASMVKASTADNTFYLAGIAGETATTSSRGTLISVWECNPNVEFRAVTKAGTLESSHIGLTKTLHWDSTLNIAYVDLSASTAADHRVVVTQLIDSIGDSGGAVAFRFLPDSRRQGSTVCSSSPFLAFYR